LRRALGALAGVLLVYIAAALIGYPIEGQRLLYAGLSVAGICISLWTVCVIIGFIADKARGL
jgi:hypothetical protein